MAEQTRFLDLSDYWHMVRRRLWLPIVFALVVAGLAAAFIVTKTPTYLARAKVQVQPIVTQFIGSTALPGSSDEPDMPTEAEIVKSENVADLVRDDLTTETTAEKLLAGLRVEVIGDSQVMYVGYEDPDADAAQTLANAFAKAYLEYRIAPFRDTFDKRIDLVETRLADAQARYDAAEDGSSEQGFWGERIIDVTAERDGLESARDGLQGGQLSSEAIRPRTPTGIGLVPVIVLVSVLGAPPRGATGLRRSIRAAVAPD